MPRSIFLLLRNSKRDLLAVRRRDEGAGLFGSRETRLDVPEANGVGAHAELRAPFFGDGFREARDASFAEGVVGLPSLNAH